PPDSRAMHSTRNPFGRAHAPPCRDARRLLAPSLAAVVLFALGGCGSDSAHVDGGTARDVATMDSDVATVDSDVLTTAPAAATTSAPCQSAPDVEQFFVDNGCIACHSGTTPPDLRFAALDRLASTMSNVRPGHRIVTPMQPTASELYLRLAGPRPADA